MKRLVPVPRKRIVPAGAALAAAIVLLAPCAAQATPYVVKLTQQGSNVVAIGSGAIDLTGFRPMVTGGLAPSAQLQPYDARLFTGAGREDAYVYFGTTVSGPMSFGGGNQAIATTWDGDFVGLVFGGSSRVHVVEIGVPQHYVFGTALSSRATWDKATFASLGITPGTYTWTWGTAPDQSFTIDTFLPVPEPAALGMFGLGVLLIGTFAGLRRRIG